MPQHNRLPLPFGQSHNAACNARGARCPGPTAPHTSGRKYKGRGALPRPAARSCGGRSLSAHSVHHTVEPGRRLALRAPSSTAPASTRRKHRFLRDILASALSQARGRRWAKARWRQTCGQADAPLRHSPAAYAPADSAFRIARGNMLGCVSPHCSFRNRLPRRPFNPEAAAAKCQGSVRRAAFLSLPIVCQAARLAKTPSGSAAVIVAPAVCIFAGSRVPALARSDRSPLWSRPIDQSALQARSCGSLSIAGQFRSTQGCRPCRCFFKPAPQRADRRALLAGTSFSSRAHARCHPHPLRAKPHLRLGVHFLDRDLAVAMASIWPRRSCLRSLPSRALST